MEKYDKNLLLSGLDLDKDDIRIGDIETNGVESKYWLEYKGKQYLYKIDSEKNFGFREVLVSFLCNALGIECVNAYPAYSKKNNQTGTIVESYVQDNSITQINLEDLIVSYSDYFVQYKYDLVAYSVEEIGEILEKLEKMGAQVDKNIIKKLKEICLLDYILLQCDRNYNNIEFLFSKKDGKTKIELAPMFDNGRCLSFYCNNIKELLSVRMCETWPDVCLLMKNRPNVFMENNKYKEDCVYFIAKEILTDSELRSLYSKICSLDFNKIVDNIAKCYPKGMDENKLDAIKETYKIQQKTLQKYIKIAQKGNDLPYLSENIIEKRKKIPQGVDRILSVVFNYYGSAMNTLREKNNLLLSKDDNSYGDGDMKW